MLPNWKARFRHAWWIGSFITLIGLMSSAARGQTLATDDTVDTRERIAVMTSGKTLRGIVNQSAGGYIVEQPDRRNWYQYSEIMFVVNDLREAYHKLSSSVTNPTAASHLSLAQWCISNRLYDEASDELKKCLKQDPEDKEAKSLLLKLTDAMRSSLPSPASKPARLMTADGFLQPGLESLGGLSRDTSTQFTSKIQPILMNKCGNASCHGSTSSNEFRLIGSRGGSVSRHNTERNLAAVMKYIDSKEILVSPFLNVLKNSHGGKGLIFGDLAGVEQVKTLKAWTKVAAEEMQANETQLAQRPKINGQRHAKRGVSSIHDPEVKPAGFTASEMPEEGSSVADRKSPPRELPADDKTTANMKPLNSSTQDISDEASRKEKTNTEPKTRDAFDPENFNRRSK
jgi:hypothetical protein